MVWLREKGRERHGSDLLSAGSPCFRSESDPVMFPGQIFITVVHRDSVTFFPHNNSNLVKYFDRYFTC